MTINFAPKARPMVIESLKDSFGKDKVFRAGVYRELEDGFVKTGIHPGGVYILPENVNIEEISFVRPCPGEAMMDVSVCEEMLC